MKQRTLYQVRVTQEIPFCDYDEDGEETQVSSGRIEEYVAGRFSAEHNAKLFAEALENEIAEGSGYVTNCFTPKVSIDGKKSMQEIRLTFSNIQFCTEGGLLVLP